jgi:hypothetical protein
MKVIITALIASIFSVGVYAQISWQKAGEIASEFNITENGVTLDQEATYDMGKKMMKLVPSHPFADFDQVVVSRNYTAKDIENAPDTMKVTTKYNGDVKTVKGCINMKKMVNGLRKNLTGGSSTDVANYLFEIAVTHYNSLSPSHVRYYQKGWNICVSMNY